MDCDEIMQDADQGAETLARSESLDEGVPIYPPGDPTINWDFLSYEALVRKFFSSQDTFLRLKNIVEHESDDVFSAIVYFVKTYQKGKIVRGENGGIYCIPDEYRNQLTSHKKRYYDFKSKTGKGEPVHKGKANPLVYIEQGDEKVGLPLPCLVALWWFISFSFDRVFWDSYDDVMNKYKAYALNNKRTYSNTHKQGRNQIRNEVIKKVIQRRSSVSSKSPAPTRKQSGKTPYLTQEERRLVSVLVSDERLKRKHKQRTQKKGKPKKANVREMEPLIVQGVGNLPE